MTTLTPLTINVTPEQREKIEHLAEINGYETADDYASSMMELLIEEAAIKEELLEGLRQSIHEMRTGQTVPASELHRLLTEDDE
jgi:hypothetical protein